MQTWRQPNVRTLAALFTTVSDPDDENERDLLVGGLGKNAFLYRRGPTASADRVLSLRERDGDSDEGLTFS